VSGSFRGLVVLGLGVCFCWGVRAGVFWMGLLIGGVLIGSGRWKWWIWCQSGKGDRVGG